ncbi:MAG: hypothetical protein MUF21_04455 [Gemmatimonadaceae bacterium]|nr:hypothetical protein [Gemmatimonadaceae bacterium]
MSDAWLLAPLLVPLATAMVLVPLASRVAWARRLSLASTLVQASIAIALVRTTARGALLVHRMGDWPVPQGIVFVGDRLATLMLVLTLVLAVGALVHLVQGDEAHDGGIHAFTQLLLAGLAGAFLTGDLFTLFVCFEVLLIASYALLVHGTKPARLRWGLHYVVLNLVGSTLFLVAAGLVYGLLGTLNLAELGRRVATIAAEDAHAVRGAALLLFVVFALKAAIAPLHGWLAGSYAAAMPAVAALFTIMTKVGIYAMLRVFGVVFGPAAGALAGAITRWLLPAALVTALVGALAALARREPGQQAGGLLVLSTGTLATSIASFTTDGVAAGLFYLVHSTLAAAVLYLLVSRAGEAADQRRRGMLFLIAAVAVAGLPPLPGFIGKALILRAAPPDVAGWLVWATVLVTSAIALLALVRGGIARYWQDAALTDDAYTGDDHAHGASRSVAAGDAAARAPRPTPLLGATLLLACIGALTIGAGPVADYTAAAAAQLLAPPHHVDGYVQRVLGTTGGR